MPLASYGDTPIDTVGDLRELLLPQVGCVHVWLQSHQLR